METNCKNCGARLEVPVGPTITCAYCGTSYPVSEIDETIKQPNASTQQPVATATDANKPKTSIGGLIFLICCIAIAVMAEIHKYTGWGTGALAPNSSVADTAAIDSTRQAVLNDEARGITHVKKTKPDADVLVKHVRLHVTKSNTFVSFTYQYVSHDRPAHDVTTTDFEIHLFDQAGNKVPINDNYIEITSLLNPDAKPHTDKWDYGSSLPQAATAKVTLKHVYFRNATWDY